MSRPHVGSSSVEPSEIKIYQIFNISYIRPYFSSLPGLGKGVYDPWHTSSSVVSPAQSLSFPESHSRVRLRIPLPQSAEQSDQEDQFDQLGHGPSLQLPDSWKDTGAVQSQFVAPNPPEVSQFLNLALVPLPQV